MSFHLPGNNSLKGKRSHVRKLVERSRSKFNASVAEVGDNDEYRKAVIGIAVVGNSPSHVDSMLGKISSFMESVGVGVFVGKQTEVIPLGDGFGENEFRSWEPELDIGDFEEE